MAAMCPSAPAASATAASPAIQQICHSSNRSSFRCNGWSSNCTRRGSDAAAPKARLHAAERDGDKLPGLDFAAASVAAATARDHAGGHDTQKGKPSREQSARIPGRRPQIAHFPVSSRNIDFIEQGARGQGALDNAPQVFSRHFGSSLRVGPRFSPPLYLPSARPARDE